MPLDGFAGFMKVLKDKFGFDSLWHVAFTSFSLLIVFSALSSHVRSNETVVSKESSGPPNILFVIADDWGMHAGIYGTRWINTPTFDELARGGLLFRNAYTPMAKCAPSRSILLTGRHLWQNESAANHLAVFPTHFQVWPEVLKEAGWFVGFTGKGWGPGIAKTMEGKSRELTGQAFQAEKLRPLTASISSNDYAANFSEFLDATPNGKAWCFWCGFLEPHRSYEYQSGVIHGRKKIEDIDRVPAYWPDDEIVRNDMLDYALEVETTDMMLGRMVDELKKRGLFENTLIIVTSDHGMPFPRVKGYAYHDSNHIPLAVSWPRGIRSSGRVIDDFVDFTDVAPTILDIAKIDVEESRMQPITGKSWRPLLESAQSGQVLKERDHVLVGKERTDVGRPGDVGYPIRGIVTKEYLYLRNYVPERWPAGNPETGYLDTDGSPTKSLILELGRRDRSNRYWEWNFGFRMAEELYDLRMDSDCIRNLANDPTHFEAKQTLMTKMEARLREQLDPRMRGEGNLFDQYPVTNGAGFYDRWLRGENPEAPWVNTSDFEMITLPK